MAHLVEVRFKGTRKAFFRHDGGSDDRLRLEEPVVVVAERGLDFGRISATGEKAAQKCGGACRSCSTGDAVAEGSQGVRVAEAESDIATELEAGAAVATHDDSTALALLEDAPYPAPADPDLDPAFLATLPAIVRRATQDDLRKANELRRAEETDRLRIIQKVREHKLDMKISDVEWQWDRSRLVVYFTSENRVDFRALVKELATAFRTRLELRQIGVRDEAARIGGLGRCGREFCCSTWLTDLSPVNLALAKDQHLSLNPQQISGGCGRLLCCLRYEHEFYVASRKRFPKDGKSLYTLRGKERVVAVDIFRERVFLRSDEHGPRIIPLVDLQEEQLQASAAGIGPDNPVGIVPVAQAGPGRMSAVARAVEQAEAEGTFERPEPAPERPRSDRRPPREGRTDRKPAAGGTEREPRVSRSGGESRDPRPPRTSGEARDGRRTREEGSRTAERPAEGRGATRPARGADEATAGPANERRGTDRRGPARDRRHPELNDPSAPGADTPADAEARPEGERRRKRRRGRDRRNATDATGPRPGADTSAARASNRAPESSAPPGPRQDRRAAPPADAGPSATTGDAPAEGRDGRRRRNRRRGRGPRPDAPPRSES